MLQGVSATPPLNNGFTLKLSVELLDFGIVVTAYLVRAGL